MIAEKVCPNCKAVNLESDNFCRNCSQKIHLGFNSVWRMISEFFTNLINYDSKLFSTLRGLFFPGFLTQQYLKKKRVPYLTPMRLFVFLMFTFFAIISIQGLEKLGVHFSLGSVKTSTTNSEIDQSRVDNRSYSLLELADPDAKTLGLLESLEIDVSTRLDKLSEAKVIDKSIDEISLNSDISEETKQQLKQNQQQSKKVSLEDLESSNDLINQIRNLLKIDKNETLSITIFADKKLDIKIKDLNSMTEDQILEKYQVTHWFEKLLTKQILKFNKESASFGQFIFQNLTWALFLEVLLMSMVFKLLYIRKKRMYVEHFIYHLHLRSFIFIISIVLILIPYEIPSWLLITILITVLIYIFISLIKVYRQSIFMSLIKLILFAFAEIIILITSVLLVMIIGSLLY